MEFLKKNFIIILAFTLPILLIIILALSVYLPSLFVSTNYDFIYVTCDTGNYDAYYCNEYLEKRYLVVDNNLVLKEIDPLDYKNDNIKYVDLYKDYSPRIFLHDTKNNESREISLKEALNLNLSSLLTSPDGITVSNYYERYNYGIMSIFGGNSSNYGIYLTKGRSKSKLNLINSDDRYYYRNNFKFIGWVLSDRN